MWSNRKARFTVIILVLVAANLALWISHREFGYALKDHPGVFTAIFIVDISVFVGFALLGLLTAWLLAFRPDAF